MYFFDVYDIKPPFFSQFIQLTEVLKYKILKSFLQLTLTHSMALHYLLKKPDINIHQYSMPSHLNPVKCHSKVVK